MQTWGKNFVDKTQLKNLFNYNLSIRFLQASWLKSSILRLKRFIFDAFWKLLGITQYFLERTLWRKNWRPALRRPLTFPSNSGHFRAAIIFFWGLPQGKNIKTEMLISLKSRGILWQFSPKENYFFKFHFFRNPWNSFRLWLLHGHKDFLQLMAHNVRTKNFTFQKQKN